MRGGLTTVFSATILGQPLWFQKAVFATGRLGHRSFLAFEGNKDLAKLFKIVTNFSFSLGAKLSPKTQNNAFLKLLLKAQ
jgi:hypothetical protein